MSYGQRNRKTTRRQLLSALGAGALTLPLFAFGQQPVRIQRIGFLYLGSRQSAVDTGRYPLFLQGMRELGYVEGKHFVIEARFADGKTDRLPELAAELVRLKVDLIVATGTPVYRALKQATTTIPIVITTASDPVGEGFAASLARPGGNMTGLSARNDEVSVKHLELLKVAVPKLSRIAVMLNPANGAHGSTLKMVEAVPQKTGLRLVRVDAGTPGEIADAFPMMSRERVDALMIFADTFFLQQAGQIAGLALKARLPSIFALREYAEAGGFMSYGQNVRDNFRRAAAHVDKIIRGAKPADLPIEQPTTFEMVINAKTAGVLGLNITQDLRLRADRIIE